MGAAVDFNKEGESPKENVKAINPSDYPMI